MERVSLYAKPFAALKDRRLPGGFEVLLTVRHIDTSLEGLSDYLSAQQAGLSVASIDRWVFDQTLGILVDHVDSLERRRLSICIGVSRHSLLDSRFPAYVHSSLRRARFPAELLTIRVAEQDALQDLKGTARALRRIRDGGCGVALEGVGSPEHTYRCIRDLPLTRVQFDGERVRRVLTCEQAESDIRSVLQVIRGFPMQSGADYVETAAIAKKLRAMGVDYAHGSVYGNPQPLRAALDALGSTPPSVTASAHGPTHLLWGTA